MVKGVNRQVLEIHDTETEYFEKALLFVKPEYSTLSESSLKECFAHAFGTTKVPKPRKTQALTVVICALKLVAAAGFGALITYLLLR